MEKSIFVNDSLFYFTQRKSTNSEMFVLISDFSLTFV